MGEPVKNIARPLRVFQVVLDGTPPQAGPIAAGRAAGRRAGDWPPRWPPPCS